MSTDMSHLTDDQLSARLDDALPAAAAAQADAHLAQCEVCRARLAELGATDTALAAALTHDPGEAYFESFADRVATRIAAQEAAAPAAVPTRTGGFWAWLGTPRRIAAIGGTFALVVAAGLTWQALQRGPATPVAMDARLPQASAPATPAPSLRDERVATEAAPVSPLGAESAPAEVEDAVPQPTARGEAAPSARVRAASPGRMQELRAVEGGESVPVTRERDRLLAREEAEAPPPPAAAGGQQAAITELKRRAVASPLARADAPAQAKEQAADVSEPAAKRSLATSRSNLTKSLATPSAPAAPTIGATRAFDEDASTRTSEDGSEWCGEVRDASGRAIAGVTVTVIETGRIARTDRAGHFCVPAAGRDATLQLLAVGFEPQRIHMRGTGGVQPLMIALQAVPALGEGLAPSRDHGWSANRSLDATPAARWDSVAARADDSLSRAKGAASRLAAMRTAADARLRAWRAQPTSERQALARTAIDRYLAELPEGPRRAEAQRWRDALPR